MKVLVLSGGKGTRLRSSTKKEKYIQNSRTSVSIQKETYLKKQLTLLLLFLVLMFSLSDVFWVTPFKLPIVKASISRSWFYGNMGYRVEHNITGSPAGNQRNYQMKITVVNGTGTSNESVCYTTYVNQSDFDDVRFTWYNTTSGQEEEIDYWCEEVNSGSNATFWVEIPEVSNVTDNTIYVYYENNNTATTSNVTATFVRVIDGDQPVVLALPMDEGSGNKTYDQSGNDNDGTLYPTPVEVSTCDNRTDWSGTNISSETNDRVEGSASIKDTIISPTAGTDSDTSYNPSGSWDCSSKKHIVFWLKCDRASTAFTNATLVLVDTSNRERHWDISFDADEWTRIKKKLDTFNGEDTGFDLSVVDEVILRFRVADTTDFYKLVDSIQIDDRPQWVDGKFGKALSFDGSNYVNCGSGSSLSVDDIDEVTVEAWIYLAEIDSSPRPIVDCTYGSPRSGYYLCLYNKKILAAVWNTGSQYHRYGNTMFGADDLNKWHHVAFVADGRCVTVYLDGNQDGQTDWSSYEIGANNVDLLIGLYKSNHFSGVIDEVRIYNRALSSIEISDLYNYHGFTTTNYAGRVLVRKRVDPEPSHGAWGSEVPYVPVHDIAVVSVAPFSTQVVKGNSIDILVEVQNEGTESEIFNVTAYCDSNIIDTQTNISLKPRDNTILTFTWNTTAVFPSNYNISTQASTVHGETDTDDNVFIDGTVKVIDYPVAYFTYLPINPISGETVTVNASESTPNGGTIVNYAWDFGDGAEINLTDPITTHIYTAEGNYTVILNVTDSEALTDTDSQPIAVRGYPLASFTYSPTCPTEGETITFNASESTQDGGTIVDYAWDFGDEACGNGVIVTHSYATFGNYTVTFNTTDNEGLSDTTFKLITVKGYPVARFGCSPAYPIVGETVTFNASKSSPNGGTIASYTWGFGDGESGSGVIVTHAYNTFGTYNVTLTVTDSEGLNNTTWLTITVFIHNVTVVGVTPSTNEIFEGQIMGVTVVVRNNGNFTETFNVTIYANTTIIQTQAVSDLAPNNQTTLTSRWNTAGTSPGNYAITVETSTVPSETYAIQTITVRTPPSWYEPLVAWLIGVPPLIWVSISTVIIIAALFRLKIIEVEVEKQLEPAEDLQDQINRLLQPLAKKDKRFIPLKQFLHQLLEKNPPPETIEFLQNTFPIIIKAITKPKEETKKRKQN